MISVAMATCNGEQYVRLQLQSVLDNLGQEDEIVISDDGSCDHTVKMIHSFQDTRIRLYKGPQKGINKNFENAIRHCRGDYIFLCDQDDFWYPDKISRVMKVFEQRRCVLVEHDAKVTDADGHVILPSFFRHRRVRRGVMKNFLRNTYHGCLMAFTSQLKKEILPIPDSGCLHDQWIGLVAELNGPTYFYARILMEYKRHGRNASSFQHLPFLTQIKNRILLGKHLVLYIMRKRAGKEG